ncbi:hypothetical protein Goari_006715, partial [Gossypium aridum]|nr:hypothetical protein [Gossypium aridum]
MQKFTRLFIRKMETFGKVIFKSGISSNPYDPYVLIQVKSGTSMANVVVVDMLSYIKSFHKDRELARIKSAIMSSGNSTFISYSL